MKSPGSATISVEISDECRTPTPRWREKDNKVTPDYTVFLCCQDKWFIIIYTAGQSICFPGISEGEGYQCYRKISKIWDIRKISNNQSPINSNKVA